MLLGGAGEEGKLKPIAQALGTCKLLTQTEVPQQLLTKNAGEVLGKEANQASANFFVPYGRNPFCLLPSALWSLSSWLFPACGLTMTSDDSTSRWSHHWPGVRNPTGWDVHLANEKPAASFLYSFQAALLHGEEIVYDEANETLLVQLQAEQNSTQPQNNISSPYTYPLSCLLNIPEADVVAEADIMRLQSSFLTLFRVHPFLGPWCDASKLSQPAYLQLASACLGAAWSKTPNGDAVAPKLFFAAGPLWIITMEMDNREARKIESVVGAALICTYSALVDQGHAWRVTLSLLYSFSDVRNIAARLTYADDSQIARRLRLTEEGNNLSTNAFAYYCMLIDTIIALRQTVMAPVFSSTEYTTKMPDSQHSFRPTYRALFGDQPLPSEMIGQQDALVLLVALLSDSIHTRRAQVSTYTRDSDYSPFRPLTAETQYKAKIAGLLAAASRWMDHFALHARDDILALFYFVRLYLATPAMDELVRLAREGSPGGHLSVSREAVRLAWSVLEHVKKTLLADPGATQIWLPVTLYHAALVVCQDLRANSAYEERRSSMFMSLEMFKMELVKMPWLFHVDVVSKIDALVAHGVPSAPR